MLINKESYQREAFTEWSIRLPLKAFNADFLYFRHNLEPINFTQSVHFYKAISQK